MAETKSIKIESDGEETQSVKSQVQSDEDEYDIVPESEIEPDEESELEYDEALESAKMEAKEHYDRLLRVSAEFENYKKRSARELSEFKKYANEALIKDLLLVVDNLERAVASAATDRNDVSKFIEGIELTQQDILKIFKKYHVTPINAVGNPFDPCFHQAVMQTESEEYPTNTIVQELQKGYMIYDRLLRPAMVVVSKSPDTAD